MQAPQETLENIVKEMMVCLKQVRTGGLNTYGAVIRLDNLGRLMRAVIDYSTATGHFDQLAVNMSREETIAEASRVIPDEDIDALRERIRAKQKK